MRTAFLKWFFAGSFLWVFYLFSKGQERPLGTWKVFLPYTSSTGMCDAGDKVYCAAAKSVFSYEKESGVIQLYDKSTGLSDVDVNTISYDQQTQTLTIAYTNSNIDLIKNGVEIYNIPSIKNSVTTSSIMVHDVYSFQGKAYVSSDVGISVINLEKQEISSTYIIGNSGTQVKVYATASDGVYLYAATAEGVKRAPLNATNLQDFNSWILFTEADNLPRQKASLMACFNGKAYTVIGDTNCDTLFEYNGGTWTKVYYSTKHFVSSLEQVNSTLYFSVWNDSSTTAGKMGKVDVNGQLTLTNTDGHIRPIEWFEADGIAWEADAWGGLFRRNNQGGLENIVPDGPARNTVFGLDIQDGVLKVAAGGVTDSWIGPGNIDGFYIYQNGSWTSRNRYTDVSLTTFTDVMCVASAPARQKTYFGAFSNGLIELDDNTGAIKLYDKWSPDALLEEVNLDTARTKISCLTADKQGNIWIGNAGADYPIKLITSDGTWKQFGVPYNFQLMKKILIDSYGQLWAPLRRVGEGLMVWSHEGTLDNPADDKFKLLTTGDGAGALPDAYVYCLAEDREGNIWAGTGQGIGIFYCPGSVFSSGGCDADQIKVERDGYIGYLFGTENVRAIAVDAANRKWIGTTNGLWLISADGKKELLRFNTENSPLPSNQVTDIVIDPNTGEVFVSTLAGLVSYQGDAIAECEDCDKALVYPNPVMPGYDGPIAIKGLTDNAYVKITDIQGMLVFQGKANGTQMIWDGKGYEGERVKSGVYMVFSSTDLGKEKRVAKILLTN